MACVGWWRSGTGHVNVHELLASLFPSGPHLSGVRREAGVNRGQILVRPEWPPRCGCFAFPNLCLFAQHTLTSMFTVYEFSSQVVFPRNHLPNSHSRDRALPWPTPPLWQGTCSPGNPRPVPSSTRCAPRAGQTWCLGGRKTGLPDCQFLSIWSSNGQDLLFWKFWSLQEAGIAGLI